MAITRRTFARIAGAQLAGAAICAQPQTSEAGFTSLFDGRTLTGWDFDARLWMVENGAIVGTTQDNLLTHDEFAIAHGRFGNFVFRTQIRLRNHRSGIQFRSVAHPEWRVTGPQAAAGQDTLWGCIYDEGGKRGVLVNGWQRARKVVHLTDWNEYEVACNGGSVQVALNGQPVSKMAGLEAREGVIALALIAGPGMQVRFRNIRVKLLPA